MQSKSANNGKVSVAATTTAVLAASGGRVGIILANDSDETIYLGFGSAAVLNEGTPIPSASALVLDNTLMTTLAINAISTNGSKNLAYTEFLQG